MQVREDELTYAIEHQNSYKKVTYEKVLHKRLSFTERTGGNKYEKDLRNGDKFNFNGK